MKKLFICISLALLLAVPAMADDRCQDPPTALDAIGCLAAFDLAAAERDFDDMEAPTAAGGPSGEPGPAQCPNGPESVFWKDGLMVALGIVGPGPWADLHPSDWALPAARQECRDDGETFMWRFWARAIATTEKCAADAYDEAAPDDFADRLDEVRRRVELRIRCRPPLSMAQLAEMDRWTPRTPEGIELGIGAEAWPDHLTDDELTGEIFRALTASGEPVDSWDVSRVSATVVAYRAEKAAGYYRRPWSPDLDVLRHWQQNERPPRPPVIGCPPCETCPPPCEPPVSAPVVVFDAKGAQSPTSDRCLETTPPSCAIVPPIVSYDAFELSIRMRITLDELPEVGENIAAFYVKGGRQPFDDALYLILKRTGPNRWKAIGRAGPGQFKTKPKRTAKLTKPLEVGVPFLVEVDRDAEQGVSFRVLKPSGELLAALELGQKAAPGTFHVFVAELGHKGDQVEHGEVPTVGTETARCVGRPEPTVWDQIDRGHGDPTEDGR
jgi:hypothetical protein